MMFNQNRNVMIDYIELSQTTPGDEPCAQVGSENYLVNSKIEALAYVEQLHRMLGKNPPGSFFKIVKCPHDFGTYLDIRFYYDDEDQHHIRYMIDVENGCEKWDDQARRELSANGYQLPIANSKSFSGA